MLFGTGIDLVEVERMKRFLERRATRSRDRLFNTGETEYCMRKAFPAAHFAARFAAKEASFKALGSGWRFGISWRDVEVTRPRAGGPPALRFTGRFSELAGGAGITSSRLSLSHTRTLATAQVLLLTGPPHLGTISPTPAPGENRIPAGFLNVSDDEPARFDPDTGPRAGLGVYVAPSAVVTGDVVLAEDSSVWHNAVVRGDIHFIRVGRRSNVQDGAVIHVTGGRWPVLIGDDVSLAHGSIVHGCRIGNGCLIGIGAVVLDGAEIGDRSLIASGCVVTEGMRVPPDSLVAGVPGQVKGKLPDNLRERVSDYAKRYLDHKKKALEGRL